MKKVILIIVILFSTSLFAQRTVSMNFDLYQNAANNIIAMEGSYPIVYSGNVGENSYYFELEQPTVEFNHNFMKMVAILRINTTPTGYLELNIEPSIYVNYSESTDNITAFLQNFPNYINTTYTQVPQWVRDKIIEHYQSLQLEMYPAKILEYAEDFIPDFLSIEISNIDFSVQSLQNKLQIVITFVVTGFPPYYECHTYNKTLAKIKSNVRVDVKRLTLYLSGTGTVYYDFNGTVQIQKGGEVEFNIYHPNNSGNQVSGRLIRVLLHSEERGTFLRVYSAAYMPSNDQWHNRTLQVTLD